MMLAEIINTCTNDKVAEAAVASISVEFLDGVRRVADERNMSVGEYTAGVVRRFNWRACEDEHRALVRAMDGSQAPILAGLRHILETMLEKGIDAPRECRRASSRARHPMEATA